MRRYEYIRLFFDFGDLAEMNSLSDTGWRVIAVNLMSNTGDLVALMERPLPDRVAAEILEGE